MRPSRFGAVSRAGDLFPPASALVKAHLRPDPEVPTASAGQSRSSGPRPAGRCAGAGGRHRRQSHGVPDRSRRGIIVPRRQTAQDAAPAAPSRWTPPLRSRRDAAGLPRALFAAGPLARAGWCLSRPSSADHPRAALFTSGPPEAREKSLPGGRLHARRGTGPCSASPRARRRPAFGVATACPASPGAGPPGAWFRRMPPCAGQD